MVKSDLGMIGQNPHDVAHKIAKTLQDQQGQPKDSPISTTPRAIGHKRPPQTSLGV